MSTHTLIIRELRAADRAAWDELWNGYLRFYKKALPQEITDFTWQRLVDPVQQPYGFVALDGERVIGFVHYHFHLTTWSANGKCYLEDLFVDPTVRGKGAGRALIEAVYRASEERGVNGVYWHTQESNNDARFLYDKVATLSEFVRYERPA